MFGFGEKEKPNVRDENIESAETEETESAEQEELSEDKRQFIETLDGADENVTVERSDTGERQDDWKIRVGPFQEDGEWRVSVVRQTLNEEGERETKTVSVDTFLEWNGYSEAE